MTTTTNTIKALHETMIAQLTSPVYPDGTYNLETMKAVDFDHGYQVTFCQVGDDYTDDDYEFLCAMFSEVSSDGIVYAGKFGGTPEVSFHFTSCENAIKYAEMFNQVSIWDWKNADEIKTGGTGAR